MSANTNQLLVKVLTPEQTNRALAEWVAVNAGVELNGMAKVTVHYVFGPGQKNFKQARVEVQAV